MLRNSLYVLFGLSAFALVGLALDALLALLTSVLGYTAGSLIVLGLAICIGFVLGNRVYDALQQRHPKRLR